MTTSTPAWNLIQMWGNSKNKFVPLNPLYHCKTQKGIWLKYQNIKDYPDSIEERVFET